MRFWCPETDVATVIEAEKRRPILDRIWDMLEQPMSDDSIIQSLQNDDPNINADSVRRVLARQAKRDKPRFVYMDSSRKWGRRFWDS